MIEVKAFKCSSCPMVSIYKSSVKRHEKNCKENPENKTCWTCSHKYEEFVTVYNSCHGGDPDSTDYDVKQWFCSAFQGESGNMEIMRPAWGCKSHETNTFGKDFFDQVKQIERDAKAREAMWRES